MWILYQLIYLLGFVLYVPGAVWRKRLPHRGWSMRLGRYPEEVRRRLSGRTSLWVHAVSVGEVLAAQPLIDALAHAHPGHPLVLSTITPGGFGVATKGLADRVLPVYFPLDFSRCVASALDTIRPRILLLMESEVWPTVIRLAAARGIPIAVVNGRLSPRAFRRYRWVHPWLGAMLSRVDLFLMQSQADADRLLQLGAPRERIHVVGSLKWDASLGSRPSDGVIRETAERLGLQSGETVLVAGSTHRGEETVLLKAFGSLRSAQPSTRLILAPRHLERVPEVEHLAQRCGLATLRLSDTSAAARWDVGLVDAFGQLPRYYGLASLVFIGGSLIPHGGQNPLEAASLGKPVIFGPSMHNFESIAHQLIAHHAARQVAGAAELSRVLQEFAADPSAAHTMGRRAQELTERFGGATARTLQALRPFLPD